VFTLAVGRHQITVCTLDYDLAVALSKPFTVFEFLFASRIGSSYGMIPHRV
jgi:hypothetical protein